MNYASGEEPRVGDVVECVKSDGQIVLGVGERYTVESVSDRVTGDARYVILAEMPGGGRFTSRFRLISRAAAPVKSEAQQWVKGAPTVPGAYWLKSTLSSSPRIFIVDKFDLGFMHDDDGATWSIDRTTHHIPIPFPPPPPKEPMALPRRFRGNYKGAQVVGVEFEDGWRRFRAITGDHFSLDCNKVVEAVRKDHEKIYDIEFID